MRGTGGRPRFAELRRAAASELVALHGDPGAAVDDVAAALWASVVYLFDDGSARVDWDADLPLVGWTSASWSTHVDAEGRSAGCDWR